MQPDKPGKLAGVFDFDRPEAPAMLIDKRLHAPGHRIAFGPVEASRKEFHQARVGIQPSKRFAIGAAPLPQAEAVGVEFDRGRLAYSANFQVKQET